MFPNGISEEMRKGCLGCCFSKTDRNKEYLPLNRKSYPPGIVIKMQMKFEKFINNMAP